MLSGIGYDYGTMTNRTFAKRGSISAVIATVILIAVAVITAVLLSLFVYNFFASASHSGGTVTQPLEIVLIQISKQASPSPSCGTPPCYTISLQISNPGGSNVILGYAVISDTLGTKVTAISLGSTLTSSSNTSTSIIVTTVLTQNVRYSITITGSDNAGNSYTSNAVTFFAS